MLTDIDGDKMLYPASVYGCACCCGSILKTGMKSKMCRCLIMWEPLWKFHLGFYWRQEMKGIFARWATWLQLHDMSLRKVCMCGMWTPAIWAHRHSYNVLMYLHMCPVCVHTERVHSAHSTNIALGPLTSLQSCPVTKCGWGLIILPRDTLYSTLQTSSTECREGSTRKRAMSYDALRKV